MRNRYIFGNGRVLGFCRDLLFLVSDYEGSPFFSLTLPPSNQLLKTEDAFLLSVGENVSLQILFPPGSKWLDVSRSFSRHPGVAAFLLENERGSLLLLLAVSTKENLSQSRKENALFLSGIHPFSLCFFGGEGAEEQLFDRGKRYWKALFFEDPVWQSPEEASPSLFLSKAGSLRESGRGEDAGAFSRVAAYAVLPPKRAALLRKDVSERPWDRKKRALGGLFFALADVAAGRESREAVLDAITAAKSYLCAGMLPFFGDEPFFSPDLQDEEEAEYLTSSQTEEGSALTTAVYLLLCRLAGREDAETQGAYGRSFLRDGVLCLNAPSRLVHRKAFADSSRYGRCPGCLGYPKVGWLYRTAASRGYVCPDCLAAGRTPRDSLHRPLFLPGACAFSAVLAWEADALTEEALHATLNRAKTASMKEDGRLQENLPLLDLLLFVLALELCEEDRRWLGGLRYSVYGKSLGEVPTLLSTALWSLSDSLRKNPKANRKPVSQGNTGAFIEI